MYTCCIHQQGGGGDEEVLCYYVICYFGSIHKTINSVIRQFASGCIKTLHMQTENIELYISAIQMKYFKNTLDSMCIQFKNRLTSIAVVTC